MNRPSLARRLARIRRNTRRPVRVTIGPYSYLRRLQIAAVGDHCCQPFVVRIPK